MSAISRERWVLLRHEGGRLVAYPAEHPPAEPIPHGWERLEVEPVGQQLPERDELIGRLIEADEALFGSGDAVSHRESAEATVRVVEGYIDERLRGAIEALRESAETLHRVSSWWEHNERSFEDCPAESCVKARAALRGQ